MYAEIERKFLVKDNSWRAETTEVLVLRQGYLATNPDCTVRVRVSGSCAWLTVKGRPTGGVAPEFEYPVPMEDAALMLDMLARRPIIEKKRHIIPAQDGLVWEVDEFTGDNAGLVLAEIELKTAGQHVPLPLWIDREVTGDIRYYNATLVSNPFTLWGNKK